jgi:phosphoribosylanthranilate isomerase
MVKVKICGITNLEDAKASINAGCDALGFVFYKKSPRYIDWEKARDIISALPKNTIKVGIFVDSGEQAIKRIAKLCKLDILQFHGKESPEFCSKFRGYKIIKAFRVQDKIDFARVLKYKTFAYLFDTFVKNKAGGTGKKFNWKLLATLSHIKRPVFLSGGLSARNVKEAVKVLNPRWVDVSSSVEASPGKKDHRKVKRFIKIAKNIAL